MNNKLTKFELPEKYVKATGNSLIFSKDTPYEIWEEIGVTLKKLDGAVQLWLGDWLNFGEKNYGEKYTKAQEETNYELQTLQKFASVAGRTEDIRRNLATSPTLTMGHWDSIANIPEDKQEKWVEKVKENKLTVKELRQAVKENKKLPTPELPKGKYKVLYCDPPWAYDVDLSSGATRSPENNYPVMDLEALKEFGKQIKELSHKDCILFMWITAPKLNWMNDVLEAWDFSYRTNLIWDKIKPNMGHYSSVRHEILIIAGKGTCAPTCDGKTIQSIDSVQSIEKSARHSEKPMEFVNIIDKLYPDYKKIELFARKKDNRPNWHYWGNEI